MTTENVGNTESILLSIKKMLGISELDVSFDIDLIIYINAALMSATQLGVGPDDGFYIQSDSELWSDFLISGSGMETVENSRVMAVKQYIFIRVKLVFDPPTTSYLIEAYERTATELEHRLKLQLECSSLGGTPFVASPEIL
jgi:hypothetical protein